jgi:O-antigen/teichoic acid export membrane protein
MFAKLKRLASQSAVYTVGGALAPSLSFLLLPLYTRVLTLEDYGVLNVVAPVYSLLSIFLTLGLEGALMRFYFDYDKDPGRLRTYIGNIALLVLGNGLVIALLLTAGGPALFRLILPNTPFNPYLLLTVWNAAISITQILPKALFRAQQKAAAFVAFSLADFLLTTFLIILFVAVLRQGVLGNLRAQILGALVMAVPALWVVARSSRLRPSRADMTRSLAFSLPLLPHLVGNWVLNVSDRLILDSLVSKGQVGLYGLGYQFGLVMSNVVALGLNNAWVPFFYEHAGDRDNDAMIGRFITYQVLGMTVFALALGLLSREIIQIMASERYWPAYQVVPFVMLGYYCRFLYLFPVNGIYYVKRTMVIPIATVAAGALNVGLNFWLVPRFGIQAAALDTFLGFAVLLVLVFAIGQKLFPIRYEYGRLARIMLVALALFAGGWWLVSGGVWVRVAIKAGLLLAFPVALWMTGFLSADERRRLGRLWQRIRP